MLLGLSWQYRAEGNHHVVFAPATPGRDVVLRIVIRRGLRVLCPNWKVLRRRFGVGNVLVYGYAQGSFF